MVVNTFSSTRPLISYADYIHVVNFTVANLVITDIFPVETQALAGAVYQVVSQLGTSIGIAVMAVISNSVTDRSRLPDKSSPEALLQGFRAVFWACFAMMVLSTLVGAWGLRGVQITGKDESHRSPKSISAPELPPLQISSFRDTIAALDLEAGASKVFPVDVVSCHGTHRWMMENPIR